jgi:SnoaL-like domain
MQDERRLPMLGSFLLHPMIAFMAGLILAFAGVLFFLNSNMLPNHSAERVNSYQKSLEKAGASGLALGSSEESAALERYTTFLKNIGDAKRVSQETRNVYDADAYFDDTLVVHHGVAEIEAYFLKTSKTMTHYELEIDNVARSGDDFYVRWTMRFAAPKISGGEIVHSIGMSQIRFNSQGKVAFHQDFWDSGKNVYAHLPFIGGAVGYVIKSLNSK